MMHSMNCYYNIKYSGSYDVIVSSELSRISYTNSARILAYLPIAFFSATTQKHSRHAALAYIAIVESFTISQFSLTKKRGRGDLRKVQPSPEKEAPKYLSTTIAPKNRAELDGSPLKKQRASPS